MGTRADFYLDTEDKLVWIASIAWDGYPEGVYIKDKEGNTKYLTDCDSEETYRKFLVDFFSGRDDVTYPQMGWPWPWENSRTTDFAYTFSRERKEVVFTCFGRGWFNFKEFEESEKLPEEEGRKLPKVKFPDMSNIMNVAWDERSGLMIFTAKEK
jgi:hypothetical protein